MAKNFARKSSMYLFYTPLEMTSIRYMDRIIVPSLLTVNEYVHYYHCPSNRIAIAPLGQDLFERYQGNASITQKDEFTGKKVILFVGNEWYRKGVWYLLLAFKAYHTKVPDSVLILTGPPQEPFISLIKSLNLGDSIRLVGNVTEEKLVYYYSNCDVFVLPSFHEGFSNTIIEVMAFGKPVITTPIAGYPVIENGKDGFIVQPGDHKKIADLLIRLLYDQELYRSISKNAIEKSKKYTWVESAKRVLKIYQSLVTQS
jgi:glycosyltransferase involved in cell wall biosynthesis